MSFIFPWCQYVFVFCLYSIRTFHNIFCEPIFSWCMFGKTALIDVSELHVINFAVITIFYRNHLCNLRIHLSKFKGSNKQLNSQRLHTNKYFLLIYKDFLLLFHVGEKKGNEVILVKLFKMFCFVLKFLSFYEVVFEPMSSWFLLVLNNYILLEITFKLPV